MDSNIVNMHSKLAQITLLRGLCFIFFNFGSNCMRFGYEHPKRQLKPFIVQFWYRNQYLNFENAYLNK